jgi:hypothetical protein
MQKSVGRRVGRGTLGGTLTSLSSQSANQISEQTHCAGMATSQRVVGWALQRSYWIRVQGGGPQAEEAIRHRCLWRKYTPAEGEAQGF